MIDDDFKVFLIEVNTNPCLELSSPLLARLIPNMLENSIRLVVDPLFPAPEGWSQGLRGASNREPVSRLGRFGSLSRADTG